MTTVAKAYFHLEGGVVYIQARLEGPNAIGDLRDEVRRGGSFAGVLYEEMARRDAGVIEIEDNGTGHIAEG